MMLTFFKRFIPSRAGPWLLAALAVGVVLLTAYGRSRAEGYYLYADQLAYYAQHPDQAAFAPSEPTFAPLTTILLRMGEQLAGLFGAWAWWAVGLYLICLFSGQRDATFGALVRLTLWSWTPYLVRGLLQSVYMALTHDPIYNPGLSGFVVDNTPPAMSEFTYVMVPRSARLGAALLGYADLYLIWQLALVSRGLRRYPHLTPARRRLMVAGLALGWIALGAWLSVLRYK